jgi:hypothetical protein
VYSGNRLSTSKEGSSINSLDEAGGAPNMPAQIIHESFSKISSL